MPEDKKPVSKIPPEVAAKPLSALTPAERKQRYEEYKKKLGRDKLEVKGGDPSLHYFWAGYGESAGPVSAAYNASEMVRLEYDDYSLVKVADAADVLTGKKKAMHNGYEISAGGLRQDGSFIIGDVILTCCPLEKYEFHLMHVEELSESQIAASVDQFKTSAATVGIPTFEPNIGS